jgi:hypothetical protein
MEIKFFEVNGTKYIASFPRDWIDDMYLYTGPDTCANCKIYGSIGDVFILFCANCATNVYHGERGPGTDRRCTEALAISVDALYIRLEDDLTDDEEN